MFSLFKYKFSHKVKDDLLHVTYTGRIKKKQMDEIMNKIYALLYRHNSSKILIDALGSNVRLELNEILSMAKTHPPVFKRAKTAVVEKADKQSQYSLYQTITENHEVNLRFFTSMQEAETWLASK